MVYDRSDWNDGSDRLTDWLIVLVVKDSEALTILCKRRLTILCVITICVFTRVLNLLFLFTLPLTFELRCSFV